MTFGELIAEYRTYSVAENVHGAAARRQREDTFAAFLAWSPSPKGPTMADTDITTVKKFHLKDFISSQKGWKSASTKRGRASQIVAALNWAVDDERIDKNPFAGVHYEEAPPRPPMPDNVLDQLLARSNKRFERVVLFLRYTGVRLGTVAVLTWEMVDWEKRIVVVPPALHKSGKHNGKHMLIALIPEAEELLKKIYASDRGESNDLIFRNNYGAGWNKANMGQYLRRLKTRTGIDIRASLHGIRHTVGTESQRGGAQLIYTSKALVHADTRVTEKFYVHVDADLEQIRDALDKSMGSRRNTAEPNHNGHVNGDGREGRGK